LCDLQRAAERSLRAAMRIRGETLPGLAEFIEDKVVVHLSLTGRRRVLGSFCNGGLLVRGDRVFEIHVNVKRALWLFSPDERPEQLLTTLLHESVHAYSYIQDIKDTSRDGRYHNANFGRAALAIGLAVKRDQAGVRTPGLHASARMEFHDILTDLHEALVLDRVRPQPNEVSTRDEVAVRNDERDVRSIQTVSVAKHISAICACEPPRYIRMATGTWSLGPVRCQICGQDFVEAGERPLTGTRQDEERDGKSRSPRSRGIDPAG
jgi:hypothetical protein